MNPVTQAEALAKLIADDVARVCMKRLPAYHAPRRWWVTPATDVSVRGTPLRPLSPLPLLLPNYVANKFTVLAWGWFVEGSSMSLRDAADTLAITPEQRSFMLSGTRDRLVFLLRLLLSVDAAYLNREDSVLVTSPRGEVGIASPGVLVTHRGSKGIGGSRCPRVWDADIPLRVTSKWLGGLLKALRGTPASLDALILLLHWVPEAEAERIIKCAVAATRSIESPQALLAGLLDYEDTSAQRLKAWLQPLMVPLFMHRDEFSRRFGKAPKARKVDLELLLEVEKMLWLTLSKDPSSKILPVIKEREIQKIQQEEQERIGNDQFDRVGG